MEARAYDTVGTLQTSEVEEPPNPPLYGTLKHIQVSNQKAPFISVFDIKNKPPQVS